MTVYFHPTSPIGRMRPTSLQVVSPNCGSCLQFLQMGITRSSFPMDAFIGSRHSTCFSARKIFRHGSLRRPKLSCVPHMSLPVVREMIDRYFSLYTPKV